MQYLTEKNERVEGQLRSLQNYLAGTFVPPAARKAYFAVRALNVELCSIPAMTGGNAATAQLRVGWWKGAVDGMFEHGAVEVFPQHPVVTALTAAVARHPDFVAVFGEGEARYSCAEVERREHRRWVRVLGADFDVQIWSADPSVQPFTVKRKGGGDASWALKVWDQLRGQTAALA